MKGASRNILIIILLVICASGIFLLSMIFEGKPPVIDISSGIKYLTSQADVTIHVSDAGRGIRKIQVVLVQEGKRYKIFDKQFPAKGFFNLDGEHEYRTKLTIDPIKLSLAQGSVDLKVSVWDHSKRRGGDGNIAVQIYNMIVDTIPPSISPISRLNYIYRGGTGLILYRTSSDTQESGIYIDKWFFKGYKPESNLDQNIRLCYFAVPVETRKDPSVYLWAKDIAGNEGTTTFNYRIKRRIFRKERINLSERFVKEIIRSFSSLGLPREGSDIERYLYINREMRKKNHEMIAELCSQSVPEKLWDGVWLRMKNSATMANFGDHRYYFYEGKKIDEQVHLGVDLASLSHAPVQSANRGRVVFAGDLGIYGLAVIIDHGQGIISLYGHMSSIGVEKGKMVKKGQLIGYTGRTGLAGGDHLHFAIMVNGVFVNPVEWWDSHWIRDNITRKLAVLTDQNA